MRKKGQTGLALFLATLVSRFMAQTTGTADSFLSSPRNQRRLFGVSVGVFVVGLGVFLAVVVFRGTGNRFTDTFSNQPAQLAKPDPKAPLQPQEVAVARRFINTAVARRDLDHRLFYRDRPCLAPRPLPGNGRLP